MIRKFFRITAGKKECRIIFWFILIITFNTACNNNPGQLEPYTFSYTILDTGTFDGKEYQLLRISNRDGGFTYAQWFPLSGVSGKKPAVICAQPYYGIDWSGDPIDLKWASRPNASTGYEYADEDGPDYIPEQSKKIDYILKTPNEVADESNIFLYNGIAVLIVYGRFYTGGSLWNDIQDMVSGFEFISRQSTIDQDNIGVWGLSWGGFMSLYGSAYADLKAKAGVSFFPPSDFVQFVNYIKNTIPAEVTEPVKLEEYQSFEPYLRRIYASTGDWPELSNSSNFTIGAVKDKLSTPFLLLHDDWDTLVPSHLSRDAAALMPEKMEGTWFPHTSDIDFNSFAIDHSQESEGMLSNPSFMFGINFLLTRLLTGSDPITIIYYEDEFRNQFSYFRNMQTSGQDITSLTPRLIEMCDDRVTAMKAADYSTIPGSELIFNMLLEYWTIDPEVITSANIKDHLEQNGIPN